MDDGINDGGGDLNVMMIALPETNKLHLKIDGLEVRSFPSRIPPIFRGFCC